ncbi:MAG: transcriptional repressor LexA [SAR324 cluster bacterium]|nr:transcriptional repressor LexA [SAR324 cluster bacterium]
MKALTHRQKEVLNFIGEYTEANGFPPSVRDIARHFNLVSAAGVHKHIKSLVKKNYLSKHDFISRSLRVIKGDGSRPQPLGEMRELPLMGLVAAGQPIEAIEQNQETLSVPISEAGRSANRFLLRVKGDSMNDDGILDGDYVILEGRKEARNGETVVALINGAEATLKRFFREDGRIRLQPANPNMSPLIFSAGDLQIQGIVVGVWRRFQ